MLLVDTQTHVRSYPGLFRSQAEDAFRRDASEAAGHGWHPVSQHWDGTELVVTYAYGPQPASMTPSEAQAAQASHQPVSRPGSIDTGGSSVIARVVLVGGGVALAAVAVLMLLGVGPFAPERRVVPVEDIRPYVPGSVVPGIAGNGVGTRAEAIGILDRRAYTGEMGTFADGRERWLAHDKYGSTATVIGPADAITEVSVEVELIDYDDDINRLKASDAAVLFDNYAPQAYAWIRRDEVRTELEEEGLVERWFDDVRPGNDDDVRVRIEAARESDRAILTYTISTAAAVCAGSTTACPPPSQVTYPISWATADVIDFLGALGFEGDVQPGEPWHGTQSDHTATVRSSGDKVDVFEVEFSMLTKGERTVVWDSITEVAHQAGIVVDTYVPESRAFLADEMGRIADGSDGGSKAFDGVEVGVHGTVLEDHSLLRLTLDPS